MPSSTQYLRSRFDALTDGVFAVAMTLLVIEIRLPDRAGALDGAGFLAALRAIEPKFLFYALSFVVAGQLWLARAQAHSASETMGRREIQVGLAYLFLITLIPFTSMSMGVAPDSVYPAWIYCANLGGLGLLAALLARLRGNAAAGKSDDGGAVYGALLLTFAALVGAVLANWTAHEWAWAFLLIFAGRLLRGLGRRVEAPERDKTGPAS